MTYAILTQGQNGLIFLARPPSLGIAFDFGLRPCTGVGVGARRGGGSDLLECMRGASERMVLPPVLEFCAFGRSRPGAAGGCVGRTVGPPASHRVA